MARDRGTDCSRLWTRLAPSLRCHFRHRCWPAGSESLCQCLSFRLRLLQSHRVLHLLTVAPKAGCEWGDGLFLLLFIFEAMVTGSPSTVSAFPSSQMALQLILIGTPGPRLYPI